MIEHQSKDEANPTLPEGTISKPLEPTFHSPRKPLSQSFPQQIASARKQKLGVSQWVHQSLRSNPNPLIPQYTTVVPGEPKEVRLIKYVNWRTQYPPSKKKKWRTQVPFKEEKCKALPELPFVRLPIRIQRELVP